MFNGGLTSGHFVRIGTGGAAPSVTLKDTSEADAVKITGAYVGDRAFTVSIRDSLIGAGRECIIYEGTTEFCRVTFAADGKEADGLVAAITEGTKDFIATKVDDGDGTLAEITQEPITGGEQPTATTTEYSAGLDALYSTDGNCLCVDTDDVSVHALVQAWIDRIYSNGSYTMACLSEPKSIALDTRMQHAAAYNDEKIIYVLNSATSSPASSMRAGSWPPASAA